MSNPVRNVVIVGGGAAGWLTAGLLAATHEGAADQGITVTLVESPDVPTVGVGEGTWPSMKETLRTIGVSETDFILECDASFKQGSKFVGWLYGEGESYYHPFTLPNGYLEWNPATTWRLSDTELDYAYAVNPQAALSDAMRAPKHYTTPAYAGILNYGYHLNAAKFSSFLQRHCTGKLGVQHVIGNICEVQATEDGDISTLSTDSGRVINGDLFVDCTGFAALLIGQHYKIPWVDRRSMLFNDTAVAVQVPYEEESAPIASCTVGAAMESGWIWDIGLPHRRGVGHVFSSAHTSADEAESVLREYLSASLSSRYLDQLVTRKIRFDPGHRQTLWHRNCVAIGISAGFIEPLEATALVLVESSAQMLSEQLPENRAVMDIIANRFNTKFLHRWDRIIDFLKLHYVLSERRTSYWRDHAENETIPESLQELLELWRYQAPWKYDTMAVDELFPSASYQYVLFGMNFKSQDRRTARRIDALDMERYRKLVADTAKNAGKLKSILPTNRELLDRIKHTRA